MKFTFKNSFIAAAFVFGVASISNAQVKVGSNPATIEATSNLEVEASTTGRKVKVDKTTGQVTIADGTQGDAKILTSDANGAASWKSLSEYKVPTTVFIGGIDTRVTLAQSTTGAVGSRVPLNPGTGYSTGWDAAQRAYIVPVAGYYRAELIAQFSNTSTIGGAVVLMLRGKMNPTLNETFYDGNAGTRTLIETAYYNVGDQICANIHSSTTTSGYVWRSNLSITYIP